LKHAQARLNIIEDTIDVAMKLHPTLPIKRAFLPWVEDAIESGALL
jgi:hypothetical protein